MRGIVRGGWEGYRGAVVQADAPDVQVEECRRAFYGGASWLFFRIVHGLEDGQEATPADLEFMSALEDELRLFVLEIQPDEGGVA